MGKFLWKFLVCLVVLAYILAIKLADRLGTSQTVSVTCFYLIALS